MMPVEYTVSMARANTHYFDVSLRVNFRARSTGSVRLMMPVWTPGHYTIEDYPKNVRNITAKRRSENGWEDAVVEKLSKNVWQVSWVVSTDSIRADYSVYAFDYRDTSSYMDTFHGIINGASVFIYPAGMENEQVTLKLVPYPDWENAATGLERTADWEFLAKNIDELIDSPIEVGNQEIHSFSVKNVEHQVSMFGSAPIDKKQFVDDIERIVKSAIELFGQIPYRKYMFIVNFTDDVMGGLEHLTSTVCFVPR